MVEGGEQLFLNGVRPQSNDGHDLFGRSRPDVDPVISPQRLLERVVADYKLVPIPARIDLELLKDDFIETNDEAAILLVGVQESPESVQPFAYGRLDR